MRFARHVYYAALDCSHVTHFVTSYHLHVTQHVRELRHIVHVHENVTTRTWLIHTDFTNIFIRYKFIETCRDKTVRLTCYKNGATLLKITCKRLMKCESLIFQGYICVYRDILDLGRVKRQRVSRDLHTYINYTHARTRMCNNYLLPKQLEPCILLNEPLLLLDDWSMVVILGASGVSTEKLFMRRFSLGPRRFCGGLWGAENISTSC